jgi:predicted AlkP superfamily phosphohydrolase/phosphomutase
MDNRKVFIFGIDGATWDVLRPMVDAGVMPTLRKLSKEGQSGILNSTIPPDTATAWTTFQTGVNPGKHGIFDFNLYQPGEYATGFLSSRRIPLETIWKILSRNNKKVLLMNVPVTYPPYEVNGWMVTGLLTPSTKSGFTYPPELAEEILSIEKDYAIVTTQEVFNRSTLEDFTHALILTERKRTKVMLHLMKKINWDVAMVHFQSTDPLQHAAYWYFDKNDPHHSSENYEVLQGLYREIDKSMEEILHHVPPQSLKIVLSDHGFRPVYKTLYMNNLLIQEGLMYLKDQGLYGRKLLPFFKFVRRIQKRFARRPLLGLKTSARRAVVELIDWSKTKAFMLTGWIYGLIHINCQGREREGIVAPGEPYENLRELISEKTSSLTDPQTGKKVIRRVYKREDLFHGRFLDRAPDLIIIPEKGYEFNQSFIESPEEIFKSNVIKKDHTGIHDQNGIFIINGNDLDKKTHVERMNIVDIFPLILYYMGVAIPEYTDGKVHSDLFNENFIKDNPIRYTAGLEKQGKEPELEAYSQEEKEKIARRLKDLGYM